MSRIKKLIAGFTIVKKVNISTVQKVNLISVVEIAPPSSFDIRLQQNNTKIEIYVLQIDNSLI